jgi:transcriptional regulator with XRE-family HTH domain
VREAVRRSKTPKQDVRAVFGARLRELRHRSPLSQEQLALLAGLDRSYVGQVERGERNLSLENIHKLAAALQVEPFELLQPAATPSSRSKR